MSAGQGAALLIVFFRAGLIGALALPLAVILVVCALALALNHGWRRWHRARDWLSNREAGLFLAMLMGLLAAFFALTGGILNPFVILVFAPVLVSATALSRRVTGALLLLALALLALITVTYLDLPWRNRTYGIDALILPLDYRAATWTALVISLVFLSLFVSWQADLARRTARALEASRQALEREQRLAHMGGLAAAAAHELGTPLATIAVTARDMADQLHDQEGADPSLIADATLLVEETLRCRNILTRLASPPDPLDGADPDGHEAYLRLDLAQLICNAYAAHQDPNISLVIRRTGDPDTPEPHPPRQGELAQALGNIVQNAVQFARSEVRATLRWDRSSLHLLIQDDGPGFAPAILDRIGQPYLKDSETKGLSGERPSLGLGLFIAASLLRHAGVTLEFANRQDGASGAEVSLSWSFAESHSNFHEG